MEINDFMEFAEYFGYYRKLLSEKQQLYLSHYLEEDYSLSEIAEEYGISRQAVYDNIKRGIDALKKYENKLGIIKRDKELRVELENLKDDYSEKKLEEIINSFYQ